MANGNFSSEMLLAGETGPFPGASPTACLEHSRPLEEVCTSLRRNQSTRSTPGMATQPQLLQGAHPAVSEVRVFPRVASFSEGRLRPGRKAISTLPGPGVFPEAQSILLTQRHPLLECLLNAYLGAEILLVLGTSGSV